MMERPPAQPPEGHAEEAHARSARTAPSITLPKGGGALRSVDEKFSVNPINGTVDLSVPLPFSQTRTGLNGALTLRYSSGAGNGVFGLGWSHDLPSIQRRTDKQLPRYADTDESDVFLLAGAEDLVPAFVQQPDGSWTRDRQSVGELTIDRYRPRIEGSFARIERITADGEAAAYWRVTSRDNVCTIYGRTAGARIADPADAAGSRVFRWLPQWSFDDQGNCVEYIYKAENLDNVPNLPPERNRLSGTASFANRYLKSVLYGNVRPYFPDPDSPFDPAPPAAPEYMFQAVFDYGDHNQPAPTPDDDVEWPCRRDPFSDCRAGFELRCYRLCRRVLFFHAFEELDAAPCLVRSLDLSYDGFDFQPTTAYDREADYILSVALAHYRKNGAVYDRRALPALTCTYQPADWDCTLHAVAASETAGAPAGLADGYQFTDLYAEGLQGILTEQANGWFYKQNLGDGAFAPMAAVAQKPSYAGLATGALQLLDLNADGSRQLVTSDHPRGYFALDDDNRWQPFRPFLHDSTVDLSDPNARLLDLDGDGRPDILITEEQLLRWSPSLGTDGYGAAQAVSKTWDEERGPAVLFADGTETIFIADMNGDGLADVVRVRNHDVSYWQNIGLGRFGPKVTMANPPYFDSADHFDPRRIQFADVSGTGAADILYLGRGGLSVWINQAGNAWSDPKGISPFPGTERPVKLFVLDLLGKGTPSIVWSSELPGAASAPLRYVDLMGGKKPYLMSGYANNLGKEVSFEYRSSSYYWLLDRQEGTPWVTKLPFPAWCLSRVETRERVSDARFVQRYRYRHGYYDHAEREFRGFGMVEQCDADSFDRYAEAGLDTLSDLPVLQPPVRTRSWHHVGAFERGGTILRQFEADYYANPILPESRLPDAVIELPAGHGLTADEAREATRACKGMLLRREVYADDGTPLAPTPYLTQESNGHIRLLQPRLSNRYAVFVPHASETVSYHYEREPEDPRIAHELNAVIDELGNVLLSASIAYARVTVDPTLPLRVQRAQALPLATCRKSACTADIITPATHRLRQPCESKLFELSGLQAAAGAALVGLDEVRTAFDNAAALSYEESPHPGMVEKRLLKHSRTIFSVDTDLSSPLPLYTQSALGIVHQSYDLQLTPGLLASLYGGRVDDAMLAEGRFLESDTLIADGLFPAGDDPGFWWKGHGTVAYPPDPGQHFYLPIAYLDPYGNATQVDYYGTYHLLVERVTDATGALTSVQSFDFRVLQPQSVKDINDNLSEARFDIVGLVTGVAIRGKGAEADDLTGFDADLTQLQVDHFLSDPLTKGPALLKNATSRLVYDFSRTPAVAALIQRETHSVEAIAAGVPSRLRYQFEYSDGLGRVAMTKNEAEPGKALKCVVVADIFTVTEVDTGDQPRWIGSGRTVCNNKGDPVMKYEPYFSLTPAYEDAKALVETGVTPVLTYDPMGRPVRTDFPDGSFSKVGFDAWSEQRYDQNDTVLASAWYAARIGGALGPAAQAAAQRSAVHNDTPETSRLDTLGRAVYGVSHNRWRDPSTNAITDALYDTDHELDIEGQQLAVIDARGNPVQRQSYDMAGLAAASVSMDGGARWIFNDAMGKALYGWDAKGNRFHTLYDVLHRPVQHEVLAPAAAAAIVFDRSVYGADKARNQTGKLARQYDASGVVTHDLYDFKGNLLSSTRTFAADYAGDIDWSNIPMVPLQATAFTTTARFDALSRTVAGTTADGSITTNTYGLAGLLTGVDVAVRGAAATSFILDIAHDAKGQRLAIDYGNGTSTTFTYDPLTFRMQRIQTIRASDRVSLQDLAYVYDPVGNVTTITDNAQQTEYFAGAVVAPRADFTYDAIYWLRVAQGRELIGLDAAVSRFDVERLGQAHPADGSALRRYQQQYDYDSAGNMIAMAHAAGAGPFVNRWTRTFTPDAATNRLASSQLGATNENYGYDLTGNMTSMPGLASMGWDSENRFRNADLGGGGKVFHGYDAEDARVRKVVVRQRSTLEERLYVGALEVFTRTEGGAIELQRQTLHVMDGSHRLAMVETLVEGDDGSAPQVVRYQYGNLLGTAALELDDIARILSYEEYYPFGSTSFQSVDSSLEAPATRYRYTGKERDEETGLYYHGARYYAPWLARWTAPDPAGLQDGLNLYTYCRNAPIHRHDPTGTQTAPGPGQTWHIAAQEEQLPLAERLFSNLQADHLLQQEIMKKIFGPLTKYRGRQDPTILAPTGKGLAHTIKSTLEGLARRAKTRVTDYGTVVRDSIARARTAGYPESTIGEATLKQTGQHFAVERLAVTGGKLAKLGGAVNSAADETLNARLPFLFVPGKALSLAARIGSTLGMALNIYSVWQDVRQMKINSGSIDIPEGNTFDLTAPRTDGRFVDPLISHPTGYTVDKVDGKLIYKNSAGSVVPKSEALLSIKGPIA